MTNTSLNFKCHSCGKCCTEVVCLPTPWDVRRIVSMTSEDVFDVIEFLEPEEIEGVDEDDPTWLKVGNKKYLMALTRDEETGCYFLDNDTNLCSIYTARPLLCRLFPFRVIENKDGDYQGFTLHQDTCCPLNKDGDVDMGPLYDLYVQDELNQEDYQELVKIFNSKNYPGKEIEDFAILFTNGFADFDPKGPITE